MIVGILVLVAVFSCLLAFPLMWTWNYVMPYLFGLKTLNWGQAWCLCFVFNSLIKSTNVKSN